MANWNLGPLLESLRGETSQAELGRRIGLSRERMGQIERGRVKWPDVDIFNALAIELEVPTTRLLRAAGANIPESRDEDLEWLISQLNDRGIELLTTLGRALLPDYRDRSGRGES